MRKIVHLSDIHFGKIDYAIVEEVRKKVFEISPDLVIVSGDLTQRARASQFKEARDFLDSLPKPQIVVPGNHDVPLYNVFDRFVNPLEKYKKFITNDLQPFFADEEIAVIGINTARSLTIKDGRINQEQIDGIRARMCELDDKMLKIVVTHHPFDLPEGFNQDEIVDNAEKAMIQIADCGADVLLAGHLHVSHIGNTAERYKLESGRSALVIQAGTATSTRGRGEANSFNLLEFEYPNLCIVRLECTTPDIGFLDVSREEFVSEPNGWRRKNL